MYDNYNISIEKKIDVNIVLLFIAFLCDIILLVVFFSTPRTIFYSTMCVIVKLINTRGREGKNSVSCHRTQRGYTAL